MGHPKKDDFNKLESVWYEKLKDDGFIDIEDTSNINRPLKSWHSFRFKNKDVKQEHVEFYYYRAKELLIKYKFINETHRIVWELHSNGWSKRQIEKAIISLKPSYKREQIGNIIKKIAKEIL